MNRTTLIAIGCVCVCCVSPLAVFAQEAEVNHNAGRKLGRGFANVLFGIAEVPNQIHYTSRTDGGGAAASLGVGRGLLKFLAREVVGVWEIVSFPLPVPSGYKPVMQPEFPTDEY
jgi:putative exosortase-associated protein (TIGR04073 family)